MLKQLLLAIDPDVKASGYALYRGIQLLLAGVIPLPQWEKVATLSPDLTIVELPQVYDFRKQKGDQNDLIRLAQVGGELAGRVGAPCLYYTPRQWKGSVPKTINHARMRTFFEQQSDEDSLAVLDSLTALPRKDQRLDALDACAFGLWGARKDLRLTLAPRKRR